MASIYKRKNKNGTSHWRAVVRIDGYPAVCNHFDRKQEADDWASDIERQIKAGKFKFDQHNKQHTYGDVVDRFTTSGALEHHKSSEDTIRHLKYWRERLGAYALVYLTPEKLGKERQLLIDTATERGTKRTPATVNRYIASLSASLTYACRQLRWIDENPCFNLIKLKEAKGRDRILSDVETSRLLVACRQSRNEYLYCIVLLALTTGMRHGEILGLHWDHIDFDNQLVHIKETKNGHPRSVPLVAPVIAELHHLLKSRNSQKSLVFASKTAFGTIDINKSWRHALEVAEINSFKFHDIRHCFATAAARAGASNIQLKTALGHRTLQMLERYTHLHAHMTRHLSDTVSKQILGEEHG